MSDHQPYSPIDCGFHDRLEDFAVRRKTVDIELVPDTTDAAAGSPLRGVITDVLARDGADWLTLRQESAPSVTIRLDRILSVDGILLPRNPACQTEKSIQSSGTGP